MSPYSVQYPTEISDLLPVVSSRRAELVGERHQQIAANARLNVFLRDLGLRGREMPPPARRHKSCMMSLIGNVNV